MNTNNTPSKVQFHKKTQRLSLTFTDQQCEFSAEFLRVHSPSAEVKGHGPGQEVLQHGKKNVAIVHIEPNGHYALRLEFDDKHDSGIFSWDYLYKLGLDQENLWQLYLKKLNDAGLGRDPDTQVVRLM